MAYTRTQWEEAETPLSAQNMNNIEDGVEEALSLSEGNSDMWAYIRNLVYPVGSIYMSVSNTNPGTLFGGTWAAWGSGKVPVGVNTSDSDFNTVEKTGGDKSHSYTPAGTNSGGAVQNHTLTVSEIPSHSHNAPYGTLIYDGEGYYQSGNIEPVMTPAGSYTPCSNTGGGGAHNHGFTQPTFTGTAATMNHLQPYITCYMWKRTA